MSEISTPFPVEPPSGPAPFAPGGIIVSSTLFTPVTGGIMAAENWRRLGQPRNAIIALLIGLIGLIVVMAANTGLPLLGASSNISLAVLIAVDVVSGLILAATQQSAYRAWVAANGGATPTIRRSGCLSYVAIVLASIVIVIALVSVLQPTITQFVIGLQKPHTYTDGGVSFTTPPGWVDANSEISQQDLCMQTNQQCIALAYRAGGDMTVNFVRFSSDAFKASDPKDIDANVWVAILKQNPDAKVLSTTALKVDGRDAFQRIYSYNDAGTDRTRLLEFVKEDNGMVVRLDITASTSTFDQYKSDIDALAGSIHFIASKAT